MPRGGRGAGPGEQAVQPGLGFRRPRPTRVGPAPAVAVAGGTHHTLGGVADGTVRASGWNLTGQLGNGTTVDRAVPVTVPGLSGVVAVAAGTYHSLALKSDGTVWAWGWNHFGQLGDGTPSTGAHRCGWRG